MLTARDAYCSQCGSAYSQTTSYPRACEQCGLQKWANPIPVAVVLVPILCGQRTGLLVVRRGIEPRKGLLSLVGGFLEEHETWQEGGAREIREETGVVIDREALMPFWYTSTEPRPNRVLLFSIAKPVDEALLSPFTPNAEVAERGVIFGPSGLAALFAFPLHVEAATRYFRERGQSGPVDYRVA